MVDDFQESSIIIADKGYAGQKIEEELKAKGHVLLALQKKNQNKNLILK